MNREVFSMAADFGLSATVHAAILAGHLAGANLIVGPQEVPGHALAVDDCAVG
jgi:hypothetical protein